MLEILNKQAIVAALLALSGLSGCVYLGEGGSDGERVTVQNIHIHPEPGLRREALLRTSDGLCLDKSGSEYRGIIAYPCHGKSNQRFSFYGDSIRIEGLCLDVAGENRQSGGKVIAYACHGKENQQWYRVGNTIRSRLNGGCLDAGKSGNRVGVYRCDGSRGQQFYSDARY
ncbi:ricin-type beta-trefoil lectin domain protein [Neisseria chenwenguii]|uniref:1,4-beta-xylanase n=1 Tax=Neisseria chenwenguii TaxID=1853278 RepID=A0A220S436_9NEIS|nr:ricin-type beta-trefoil lectin domain protein [Neisseria chenwenguii]ASK28289.1 1,4-beta-xylanase [Neisseria chenwenguii]ROV57413.1 1,4-beta-xylanase [Neisseria chenwenguii]